MKYLFRILNMVCRSYLLNEGNDNWWGWNERPYSPLSESEKEVFLEAVQEVLNTQVGDILPLFKKWGKYYEISFRVRNCLNTLHIWCSPWDHIKAPDPKGGTSILAAARHLWFSEKEIPGAWWNIQNIFSKNRNVLPNLKAANEIIQWELEKQEKSIISRAPKLNSWELPDYLKKHQIMSIRVIKEILPDPRYIQFPEQWWLNTNLVELLDFFLESARTIGDFMTLSFFLEGIQNRASALNNSILSKQIDDFVRRAK